MKLRNVGSGVSPLKSITGLIAQLCRDLECNHSHFWPFQYVGSHVFKSVKDEETFGRLLLNATFVHCTCWHGEGSQVTPELKKA